MSKKYHINPDTKEVGLCIARKQCKFGAESPHFESVIEAHEEAENQLNDTFGTFYSMSKNRDPAHYPDPTEFNQEIPYHSRTWGNLEEYIQPGNFVKYDGEVYEIEEIDYNPQYLQYTLYNDKNDFTISNDEWISEDLDLKLLKKPEEIDYNQPPEEDFSENISKAHRAWQTPDQYFSEGDYIKYNGEIQKIKELNAWSAYGIPQYEFTTNRDYFIIDGHVWRSSDDLDISIVSNSPSADLLKEFPPGYTGSKLSDYVNDGDSIEYNGEVYEVKDFEYERGLLSYVVETDKGTIYIHDDDWYHDSKIRLLK